MRLKSGQMLSLVAALVTAIMLSLATRVDSQNTEPAAGEDESGDAVVPVRPRPAEIMPLAVHSMLLDVEKVDSRFVAVGDRGSILLSSDGAHWEQVSVPLRAMLTAVDFSDSQHGCAVGHDAGILMTSDGGTTWKLQQFKPELEKPILDVLFLDTQHGFVVGAYGLLQRTSDGGASWSDVDAPSICEDELHLNSIIRLKDGRLLIVGEEGMIGISADQGASWERLESPYASTFFGAVPVGDKGALIYGMRGNAYASTDVGQSEWSKIHTNSVATMFGGTPLGDGRIALVGVNGIVLVIEPDGKVRSMITDNGKALSAAIPFEQGLLAVGESGVEKIELSN